MPTDCKHSQAVRRVAKFIIIKAYVAGEKSRRCFSQEQRNYVLVRHPAPADVDAYLFEVNAPVLKKNCLGLWNVLVENVHADTGLRTNSSACFNNA